MRTFLVEDPITPLAVHTPHPSTRSPKARTTCLGRLGGGVQPGADPLGWCVGRVALARCRTARRGQYLTELDDLPGPNEVYYQLAGLRDGTRYTSRVELFGAEDDAKKPARLSIDFETTATAERIEVARSLGLQNLAPGGYRVRLTVRGGGGTATAAAWLTVVK
mgnify:CR=1 FL=1